MLRVAAYTLRFILELVALVSLGYWGVQTGTSLPAKLALGVAAPLFAAGVWGTFVAPKAPYRLSGVPRLLLELALFGGVVLALLDVREVEVAGSVAGLALVTSVAVCLLEREASGETASD